MKIKLTGSMTLGELGEVVHDITEDVLEQAGQSLDTVKIDNPIVQLAFLLEGQEEAVILTTEHNEMLQVEAEVKDGKIVTSKDNQDEPTEDRRLWSQEKILNEPEVETPTEEITSDYDQAQIEYIKEFDITDSLKQKIYRIVGTDKELVRYFNTELNILVAEEVAEPVKEESE
ncbi:hypothetical protein Q9R38_26170 [Priestia aryabhattai]|uniref:hypothetical protein n=1 Tax=Priestia aryabhattai TaxID=412384 RepID=UPI002881CD80|nr:hypothetical protein [Priestia aryabhattai]MDT0150031.1 hypothetical protein [Priestia aryabhattai]MDT0155601.1 hypothetical protein [Priestia aryabhattai]